MDRRSMLRGVAALASGAAVAGCSKTSGEVPMTAPEPPAGVVPTPTEGDDGDRDGGDSDGGADDAVVFDGYSGDPGPDGDLVVTISVRNESDREQVRYVRTVVTVADDGDEEELTAGAFVRVAPGETETVRLPVDVAYDRWEGNGGFVPEILDRTPETPLPTETST